MSGRFAECRNSLWRAAVAPAAMLEKAHKKTATLTDAGWPLQLTFRCETGSLDLVFLVEDVKDHAQRDQTDNTFVSEC
jgi:hypothetical protein